MQNKIHILDYFLVALLSVASVSPVFAADQVPAQSYPWPMWHGMHWSPFWWIFPLMFFIFMVVMIILMIRKGGFGCMWRDHMMNRSEFHDVMKRSMGESSETALDILNKRYARGEIDKQEYEEKKAAISDST